MYPIAISRNFIEEEGEKYSALHNRSNTSLNHILSLQLVETQRMIQSKLGVTTIKISEPSVVYTRVREFYEKLISQAVMVRKKLKADAAAKGEENKNNDGIDTAAEEDDAQQKDDDRDIGDDADAAAAKGSKQIKPKKVKRQKKRRGGHMQSDEAEKGKESQQVVTTDVQKTSPAKKETPAVKGIYAKDMLGALASTKYPPPRLNPVLWFKGSNLFVYGGLVEVGSREITLNDLWSVNVLTRKEWKCLSRGTLDEQIWYDDPVDLREQAEEDAQANGDSDDEYSSSDSEYDSESMSDDEDGTKEKERQAKKKAARTADLRTRIAYYNDQLPDDKSLCPLLGESLKDFNERTKQKFFEEACNQPRDEYYTPDEKELRRDAFKLCQRTYYSFKPILDALQKLNLKSDEANRIAKEKADRVNALSSVPPKK